MDVRMMSDHEGGLSANQRALWMTHQMAPDGTGDHVACALLIRAALDVPALERAFQMLVDRYAILRTTFETSNGEPSRRVSAAQQVAFERRDAFGLTPEALVAQMTAEARRPFDLEAGPLFRVSVFSRSPQEHGLLLVSHAIVADAASLVALLREVGQCYASVCAGTAAELTGQEIVPAVLDSTDEERLWAYWQAQLDEDVPLLPLPLDYPRPWMQTYRGAACTSRLPAALTQRLRDFCEARGASLFATALATLAALLYRYSGQDDVWVGSEVSLEDGVGPLSNTVVLRGAPSGDVPFAKFLEQVQATVAQTLEHRAYPFAVLVERLLPERDFSRPPLFQVACSLCAPDYPDSVGLAALRLGVGGIPGHVPGFAFESLSLDVRVARQDLALRLGELDDELVVLFEYNADLFAPETVARMMDHWTTLLESALDHPVRTLAELDLLTGDERRQLLVSWNATRVAYDEGLCLHALFEEQAARVPDNVALLFEDQCVTYAELNARANQLARFLQTLGVGPESRVGLCMERSPEAIVGILAILKAGGSYVPLLPDYPQERLAFVLDDARIEIVLTQERLAATLPPSAQVVCVDAKWGTIAREPSDNASSAVLPGNLAYIIYTSGSTGKPKGVLIPHRGIVNRMLWQREYLDFGETDRALQKAPFVFDVSVGEIFLPLTSGAALVIAQPGSQMDSLYLAQLIADQEVTFAHFVPSMLRVFLKAPNVEALCLSLKHVWCGGEALPSELEQQCRDSLGAALYNGYGPTEASVGVTAWTCESAAAGELVPIGRPIANTRIYLLDDRLQPVPVGVPGELYTAGLGLARGYLDRPGLTAETFIPDPFAETPGERLYRTGDLARYAQDGRIEFLGRRDQQVKVRGFRVELGEIEAVLGQHPVVSEVVVDVCEDGQRLAAYVVAEASGDPATGELRDFVAQQLPDYMVPSVFVLLDAIPLTRNGKIDRKALAASVRQAAGGDYVAPRTPVEEALTRMWAEELGIERVGIHDNFFELGGHSLMVVQMMGQLQDIFMMDAPLIALFFETPTVASVADALMQSEMGQGNAERVAEVLNMVATMSEEEIDAMLFDMEDDFGDADFAVGSGW